MSHPHDREALSSRFDLEDAMAQGERCPVCHLLESHLVRYLDAINYEAVNDPGFRQSFLDAQGFCNVHAYQWLHRAFVLGTASLYRELLAETLDAGSSGTPGGMRVEDRIARWFGQTFHGDTSPTHPPCPICAWLDTTEAGLISILVTALGDSAFAGAYNRSTGLCLPHLHLAIARAIPGEARAVLEDRARATEERLVAQLAEIIRKHDYRFSHEPPGEETGAAARAIAHAIGFHGLIPRS